MNPSYSVLRVAGGDDPVTVLEAMFLHPEGQHVYMPPAFTGRRVFDQHKLVGEDHSLTKINGDWLDKWHHENPEYEIREHGHEERETPHFAGDDPSDPEAVGRHHQVYGNIYHKPTKDKVGDFGFSLARWPLLSRGGHSPVVTAHVHSLFRNRFERDHEGMMTHTLDSYLNHAKEHGVRHAYVNEDVSDGYWLKNVSRHPDMVWGGVEFKELKGHTNDYDTIANRRNRITGSADTRGSRLIARRQDLFHGWPGYHESVSETDAYTMQWNKLHPKPEGLWGPLPTTLMRFDKGTAKMIPSHMDKACHHHAVLNAKRNPKLRIATGFVVPKADAEGFERGEKAPMMFTHSFNVNQHGEVHDSTLGPQAMDTMRYYGHVVPDHVAKTFRNGEDLSGWFGHHFQGLDKGHVSSIHLGQMRNIDHANSK